MPTPALDEATRALEQGGLREQHRRARLLVTGKDRVEFVNRMCTNDLRGLRPGFGVAAVLPTVKGRIVDLVKVFAREEAVVLLGSDDQGPRLKEWLEKYIVMEELALADAAATESSLLAFGPQGESAVRQVLGAAPAAVAGGFSVLTATFEGATVWLLGHGELPLFGIELLAPTTVAPRLAARLVAAGLTPVGEEAWSQIRVEVGLPLFGRELTDNVNPLEASLLPAISFSKGCYIGQEVVARLNSYSKVQRRLVGARFPATVEPADVHEIFVDLLRIGHATSAVRSPRLGATVAFAFVKTDYAQPGTAVYTVRGGEQLHGVLCELPFR